MGRSTFGDVVLKHGARKIRRLHDGQVLAGFAGAVADALTLIERFEQQLDQCTAISQGRRGDGEGLAHRRAVRHLEADLIVADSDTLLLLSGDGEVLEPDEDAIAIGAGGTYAYAAARALLDYTELDARAIVEAAMQITARICIYTNDNLMVETVGGDRRATERGTGDGGDRQSVSKKEKTPGEAGRPSELGGTRHLLLSASPLSCSNNSTKRSKIWKA